MSDGRHALVVATASYGDPKLQQLRAPAADAEELANVLGDPEKGDFAVEVVVDETHAHLTRAIASFFRDRRPEDLLLLHFSCHGVKDEDGELYLAASDTDLELLSATGISAAWLNERISRTRSRRTVVLLDCCFSGSFPSGLRARGDHVDAPHQLQGRGRAIITASNAMEYAYEGEQLKGRGRPSVFTEAVVEGLRTGEADLDQDQRVSIDDLYRYVYDRVRERTPSQTPSIKSDLEGPLFLARSSYRRPVEPAQLDPELLARTEDRYAGIREGAVQELAALLAADPSIALAARHALLRMTSDDSRRVSARAQAALEAADDAERAAGDVVEHAPAEGDEAAAGAPVTAAAPPADATAPPAAVPPPAAAAAPPPAVPDARPVATGHRRVIAAGAAIAVIVLAVVLVLVVSGGNGGGGEGSGGDGGASPIPAGNLTTNPSFESNTAGWDHSDATIATKRAADAPDGKHVVRVRALAGGVFGIDDSPDTIKSSVAGRRYKAAAWVKGTESTNGELACISLRERKQVDSGGGSVGASYAGDIATVSEYKEIGTFLVAKGTGNRIDVHVYIEPQKGGEGDAFLADAISIAGGPGGVTSRREC